MKELNIDEIKEIQLDILDYFHKVCVENYIDYYLSSGTLLGAIKYDGYIPWDDDIDVWIKAEDLERLEKIINGKNNHYHFCDCMHEENYPLSYCKVMRTDTVIVENAHSFRNYPLGINTLLYLSIYSQRILLISQILIWYLRCLFFCFLSLNHLSLLLMYHKYLYKAIVIIFLVF